MSACPSSADRPARRLHRVDTCGVDAMPVNLLTRHEAMPFPTKPSRIFHASQRHLAIAVSLCWAHDLPVGMRIRARAAEPREATIGRTLQTVDAEAVDVAASAWLVTGSSSNCMCCLGPGRRAKPAILQTSLSFRVLRVRISTRLYRRCYSKRYFAQM